MDTPAVSRPRHNRRDMLKSSALALLPLAIPSANHILGDQQPMTANGGSDPYPIPFQRSSRPVQHNHGHGRRQSNKSDRVWKSHN